MREIRLVPPIVVPEEAYMRNNVQCPNCKLNFSHVPPEAKRTFSVARVISIAIENEPAAMQTLQSMKDYMDTLQKAEDAEATGSPSLQVTEDQYNIIVKSISGKFSPFLLKHLYPIFKTINEATSVKDKSPATNH